MSRVYWLGAFIPVALALRFVNAEPTLVFAASADGAIPTAALMGEATEQLAARAVPVLVSDGESTWFEGFQLLALYAVLGIVFYFA